MKKRVLITGASKGIGRAIALELLKNNYHVIGTSRNPDTVKDKIKGVEYHPLELGDRKSIEKLIKNIDHIDIVINNAGTGQVGPTEDTSMEIVERVFQLNIIGAIHLIKGFLPRMRERGNGTIVNISSMASRTPVPFSSIYAATKSGLEAFSKALRNEVKPFGINVVTVIPHYINTTFPQENSIDKNSPYYEKAHGVKQIRDESIENGKPAEIVGKEIVEILKKKNPRASYPVGSQGKRIAFLNRHLPERVMERMIRKKFMLDS